MLNTVNYLNQWGDTETLAKIRKSEKSSDLIAANCENHLKEMSMRFERSPNQTTIKYWASDIASLGVDDRYVAEVCKSIPLKFEKHPTLSQILELLRPQHLQVHFPVDELTDLSNRCRPHLKAKFLALADQEILNKLINYYKTEVFPGLQDFSIEMQESCVLNDWLRTYFKKSLDIFHQGKISNQKAIERDYDYFLIPLRRYAKEHNL